MSSPTLDIDELVQPVPGDDPAGRPLDGTKKRELDAWRKEPDPDFPESSDLPPPEWGKIIATASEALARTGKDLTVAVRLVEALTKKHATAGLRDGLTLLTRLASDCWDHLLPAAEAESEGSQYEGRLNRLNWLNDIGTGGKFPATVLRMAAVKTARGDAFEFTAADWLDPARRAEVADAAGGLTGDDLRAALGELNEARDALKGLASVLDEKMGRESPNLAEDGDGNLGNALLKCVEFVRGLAHARGLTLDDAPPDDAGGDGLDPAVGGGPAAVGGSRDQLYRQLDQIAAGLRRLEPHSPVPFLIERCVRMGALSFPDLMREVLGQQAVLDEINKLLGIKTEG